jgi:hypothetical protein
LSSIASSPSAFAAFAFVTPSAEASSSTRTSPRKFLSHFSSATRFVLGAFLGACTEGVAGAGQSCPSRVGFIRSEGSRMEGSPRGL